MFVLLDSIEVRKQKSKSDSSFCSKSFTIMIWTVGLMVTWFSFNYQICLNKTNSLTQKIFCISRFYKNPSHNSYIAFIAPDSSVKPGEVMVKIVKGMPGSVVSVKNEKLYIDEQYMGDVKNKSLAGRKLQPNIGGVIPAGKYFAWTPHKDSYDSRYLEIGLVDESSIVGLAFPVI